MAAIYYCCDVGLVLLMVWWSASSLFSSCVCDDLFAFDKLCREKREIRGNAELGGLSCVVLCCVYYLKRRRKSGEERTKNENKIDSLLFKFLS